ncbi:hypothetical protein JCM11491_004037 [Sporobolomyces phaffii]
MRAPLPLPPTSTPFCTTVSILAIPACCNEALLDQLSAMPVDPSRDVSRPNFDAVIQAIRRVAASKDPGDDYAILHTLATGLLEYARDQQDVDERRESREAMPSPNSSGLAPKPLPVDPTFSESSARSHLRSSPPISNKPTSRSVSNKSYASTGSFGFDAVPEEERGGGGAIAGDPNSGDASATTSSRDQPGDVEDPLDPDDYDAHMDAADAELQDEGESDTLPRLKRQRGGREGTRKKTLSELEQEYDIGSGDEGGSNGGSDEDQLEVEPSRKRSEVTVEGDVKGKDRAVAAFDGNVLGKKRRNKKYTDELEVGDDEEEEAEEDTDEPKVFKKSTRSKARPTVGRKDVKEVKKAMYDKKVSKKSKSAPSSRSKDREPQPEEEVDFSSSEEFIVKRTRRVSSDSDDKETNARGAKKKTKNSSTKKTMSGAGKKRVERSYTPDEGDGDGRRKKRKSKGKGKSVVKKRSRKSSDDSEQEEADSATDGDSKKSKGPSSRRSSRSSEKAVVKKTQRASNASTGSNTSRSTRASTSTCEYPVDPKGTRSSGRLHRSTKEVSDEEEQGPEDYEKGSTLIRIVSQVIRSNPKHPFFWHAELPSCKKGDDLAKHECLIHQDFRNATTVSHSPPLPSLASSKTEQRNLDLALEFANSPKRVRAWYDLAKTSLPSLKSDDEDAKGGFKGRRTKQAQKPSVVQESSDENADDDDNDDDDEEEEARVRAGKRSSNRPSDDRDGEEEEEE